MTNDTKINEQTLATILDTAQGNLTTYFEDYQGLKNKFQQTIAINAILVGILFNFTSLLDIEKWPDFTLWSVRISVACFLLSVLISLIKWFPVGMKIGALRPEYLYENYALKPPVDLYKAQLKEIIDTIDKNEKLVSCMAVWVRTVIILTGIGTFLLGIGLLNLIWFNL